MDNNTNMRDVFEKGLCDYVDFLREFWDENLEEYNWKVNYNQNTVQYYFPKGEIYKDWGTGIYDIRRYLNKTKSYSGDFFYECYKEMKLYYQSYQSGRFCSIKIKVELQEAMSQGIEPNLTYDDYEEIIRCIDRCIDNCCRTLSNAYIAVFTGTPYNRTGPDGKTVKAVDILPNEELDKIIGVYTPDEHASIFKTNYYAVLSDNYFKIMADINIINVKLLNTDFPELATKIKVLSEAENIEIPIKADVINKLKNKFTQYYIDWMEKY